MSCTYALLLSHPLCKQRNSRLTSAALAKTPILYAAIQAASKLTMAARRSGSVCLDVINQTWSPMYSMVNIFEVFLPQLLRYPNPTDPLNGEAAALMMRDLKGYDAKVKGETIMIRVVLV